jgi:hypothetical protein
VLLEGLAPRVCDLTRDGDPDGDTSAICSLLLRSRAYEMRSVSRAVPPHAQRLVQATELQIKSLPASEFFSSHFSVDVAHHAQPAAEYI